jgi:hypothetical protein
MRSTSVETGCAAFLGRTRLDADPSARYLNPPSKLAKLLQGGSAKPTHEPSISKKALKG